MYIPNKSMATDPRPSLIIRRHHDFASIADGVQKLLMHIDR